MRLKLNIRNSVLLALLVMTISPEVRSEPEADADAVEEEELVAEAAAEAAADAPPFWFELYGEGIRSRKPEKNTEGFSEIKFGHRFDLALPIDVYAKTRINRDQRDFFWSNRSDIGLGFRFSLSKFGSWTIFGEALVGEYLRTQAGVLEMNGMQSRMDRNREAIESAQKDFQAVYRNIFLLDPDFISGDSALYRQIWKSLDSSATKSAQSLSALDQKLADLEASQDSLITAMDNLAAIPANGLSEFRGGLIYWFGWGEEEVAAAATEEEEEEEEGKKSLHLNFPFRFWGNIYSDCIYSSLSRHVLTRKGGLSYQDSTVVLNNLIYYANPHIGWVLMDGVAGRMAGYLTGYLWFDTNKDWWNNLAMTGPGLNYKPFSSVDLSFTTEYVFGRYYGREKNTDPNPYPQSFTDFRISANFWYGLGH